MIPAIASVSAEGWGSIVRTSAWLSVNVSGYQDYLLISCYCSTSGACGRQVQVLVVLLHYRFDKKTSCRLRSEDVLAAGMKGMNESSVLRR